MNDQQLLRYSRHILLDEIDIGAQERVLQAKVLVFGAGGLGSPALTYLAAAGCGQITVVDPDQVDLTNLQRQIIHTTDRVGQPKTRSAAQGMQAINPDVQIHCISSLIAGDQLDHTVSQADIVLDCTDNFATRQHINDACVRYRKPLVSGAAIRWDAQITVFDMRHENSPCYACLYPPENPPQEVACSTLGIFGPLTGIIGTMQAAEALKLIMNIGDSLQGRLLMLNALQMEWVSMRIARRASCPVCGKQRQPLHTLLKTAQACDARP